jgi:hypothetical protein
MAHILKTTSVAACGLATSLLTALLVTVIERLTTLDIFTFSVWFIIPVGAIGTGLVAASGYYFGSLYFHTRPSILLLLQMIVIAGLTQLLIYYTQYATLIIDGQRVSDFVSFGQYLDVTLTTAHYRVGRGAQLDTGEVGQFGYWLAVIQFIGFLVGGFVAFGHLLSHPVCSHCKKYLRVLAKSEKAFPSGEDLATYHDTLFQLPADSRDFAQMAKAEHKATGKGTWKMTMKLFGCPECKIQTIGNEVHVYNGKEWRSVNQLARKYAIPPGVDLAGVFRAKA